jgi:transposase InsO family protein
LVAGFSVELWKWHRRLGHLSFDLLSRLSGLGLVRGLPKLKYQKDLVCAPCRHGKMDAASHPPLTSVMIERPCELFHMDLVGPARVCSAGGKWYVIVIVDDYSRYAWVFFLADKGETFGLVRDLILRLTNERHGDAIRAIRSDNGSEFKNSHFETFCCDLGLEHQFSSPYVACQNGVVERKIVPFVRWLGRCSTSIGLRGDIGRKQ